MGEVAPAMTEHLYYLQSRSGKAYSRTTREKINALIEKGEAEWSGVDGHEEKDQVIYYADRISE